MTPRLASIDRQPADFSALLKEAALCRTLAYTSSPTLARELEAEAERLELEAARRE